MDRTTRTLLALLAGAAAHAVAPRALPAQGLGARLKRAAAEAAEAAKQKAAERQGEEQKAAEPREKAPTAPADAPTEPAPRADAGRDFTPGTRVLFATDFTRDEVGDFPRAFRLRGGNAEVAVMGGRRWLRATSFGELEIPLPETLPERFTIELDFAGPDGWGQYLYFKPNDPDAGDQYHVQLSAERGGVGGPDGYDVAAAVPNGKAGVPMRVQIMADGDYVKVYMNGTRVANAPNAAIGRSRVLRLKVSASQDAPMLIADLRVAAGGKDLYRALADAGRVTADGILFDTNSDGLRAESAPVLKEIADMLAAHPALRLAIEGHTDDVGGAAANLALSEKRAAAVRRHLVATLGVDAARLTSGGFGATRPVAPNDSDANRQKNRRVELVRQ